MTGFEGKVAVVTGSASGIGAAVTTALIGAGATVVAADISKEALDRLAQTIGSDRLVPAVLDVTDSAAVTAEIDRIAGEHGGIDIVIANAGIGAGGGVAEVTDELWSRIMRLDVDGVFHIARAALPHLIARGGTIVNTASISGLGGDARMAAYNAAKGAVVNMTRSMAVDYGPHGVRVNAVAPGPTATPALRPILDGSPDIARQYAERIPLGRVAEPEDIAAVMMFLASDAARYVNGVVLPVDGGLSAWTAQPDLGL